MNMNYFVNASGNELITNSVVIMATLIAHGLVHEMQWDKCEYPKARIARTATRSEIDKVVNKSMVEQVKLGKKQLFLCAVTSKDASDEELAEAKEGERRSHEEGDQNIDELAWDDVNDCELELEKSQRSKESRDRVLQKNESI